MVALAGIAGDLEPARVVTAVSSRATLAGHVSAAPARLLRAGAFVMPSRKKRPPARAARGDGRGDADRRDRRRNDGRDTWTFRCRPRAESAEELARLLGAVPSSDQRRLALASDGRASFERLLREGDSQPGRVMYR